MLRVRQLQALTKWTLRLHDARDYSELAQVAVEAAKDLVPCDGTLLSFRPSHFHGDNCNAESGGLDWDNYLDRVAGMGHEDPVYTARLRLLLEGPGSASDFLGTRQFANSWLTCEVFRALGLRRVLVFPNPGPFGQALLLGRARAADFSPADHALIHALGRHIPVATDRLMRSHSGRLPLAAGKLGIERLYWMVVNHDGRVLRAQESARNCMQLCAGPHSADLIPAEWRAELRSRAAGCPARVFRYRVGRSSVSVHVAPIRNSPGETSVSFVEYPEDVDPSSSLHSLGLTPREAEVVRELSNGRTNADIGKKLGISAATAKKHVENILEKLGVPSRAAAVALVLTTMQARG